MKIQTEYNAFMNLLFLSELMIQIIVKYIRNKKVSQVLDLIERS